MEENKLVLPAIAVRGIVPLPNNEFRIEVGRENSVLALDAAEKMYGGNVLLLIQKDANIVDVQPSDIEKIGKIGSGTFTKYNNMSDIKRMILTSNAEPEEGKDFFYIVANVEEEKKLFVLECTETFMVNVLKFSRKTVLEEDYGK